MKANLRAGASNFASLFGRAPSAGKPREDEDPDGGTASADDLVQGDDESDEDFEKRKKEASEDKKRDDESDDEHAARVSANKARRQRQAAKAEEGQEDDEGDDDSDKEDDGKKAIAAARSRERARCAAIMGDKAMARNPGLAFQLAFGTNMPRGEAIALLRASGTVIQPGAGRPSLVQRMAAVSAINIPASAPARGGNGGPVLTEPEKAALRVQIAVGKTRNMPQAEIDALTAKLAA